MKSKNEFIEGDSWKEAYPILSGVINEMNLRLGAEIGVAYGGHIEYILSHTHVKKIYAVDPYRHFFWGYKDPMNLDQNKFDLVCEKTKQRLSKYNNRVIFVREKSQNAFNKIKEQLDFVYIDANHTYGGVKKDIEVWFQRVRKGGVIGGHDYNHPNFPGIKKAVDEFSQKYNLEINAHKSGVWWSKKQNHNISFIIPAYNCEDTIEDAVKSIINNNLEKGDEIVITDDFSTDNTSEIIKKMAIIYPFIKLIRHSENRGGGAARNTAVKNSKNELIFCLDSDNLLVPESIPNLKKMLLLKKLDAVAFENIYFFKRTTLFPTHYWKYKERTTLADVLSGNKNPATSGNYLFTKKSWKKAGGYPEKCGALDAWGFGIRQTATGTDIHTLPNSYYNHRYGNESYWVRYSKMDKISSDAFSILKPFTNQIDTDSLTYINNNPFWLHEITNRPIKLKNGDIGKDGTKQFFYLAKIKARCKENLKTFLPAIVYEPLIKIYSYCREKLN